MNKRKFNSLLSDPSKVTEADLLQLEELQKDHSYSQVVHALVAKSHYRLTTESSPQKVGFAAMHSADRKVLKAYLDDIGTKSTKRPEKKPDPSPKKPTVKSKVPVEKSSTIPEEKVESKASPVSAPSKEIKKKPTVNSPEPVKKSTETPTVKKSTEAPTVQKSTEKPAVKPKPAEVSERSTPSDIEKIRAEIMANLELLGKSKGAFYIEDSEKKSQKKKASKKALTKNPPELIENKLVEEINSLKEKPIGKKQAKQNQLIEEFIEKKPRIRTPEIDPESPDKETMDLAKQSVSFGDDLVSENLALIFVQQGKKAKAIDIYKKLIWKYPQKKTYFAGQIKALQKK